MDEFRELVRDYYRHHGRELPWRLTDDPYKILVSEIMLQQTQVKRVIPKYQAFLNKFPTITPLADSSLGEVLRVWSGLGYNRRAKYLHEAAKALVSKQRWTLEDLVACKGIGHNTAAAVMVYAYNLPVIFIETNIRTVYIRHFFSDHADVSDKDLLPVIEATLDKEHPREFYWALMDYGSHLKATEGNSARFSKHYAKQSTFLGSNRQLRGQVLKLLAQKPYTAHELQAQISDDRLAVILADLTREGLVRKQATTYSLD